MGNRQVLILNFFRKVNSRAICSSHKHSYEAFVEHSPAQIQRTSHHWFSSIYEICQPCEGHLFNKYIPCFPPSKLPASKAKVSSLWTVAEGCLRNVFCRLELTQQKNKASQVSELLQLFLLKSCITLILKISLSYICSPSNTSDQCFFLQQQRQKL